MYLGRKRDILDLNTAKYAFSMRMEFSRYISCSEYFIRSPNADVFGAFTDFQCEYWENILVPVTAYRINPGRDVW